MKRNLLLLSLVCLGMVLGTVMLSASASSVIPGSCHFECESIPNSDEVMQRLVRGSLPNLPSRALKVIVWNIYKGKKPEFSKDFASITRDADVVLLSEVVRDQNVEKALLALPQFGWDLAVSWFMKGHIGTGVVIGSTAEARKLRYFRTQDLEPIVNTPKVTLLGEFALEGRGETLLAISIHGINWAGDEALQRQLDDLDSELASHQGPILFAGDFNTKNAARVEIVKKHLAKFGMTRVKWENPKPLKQLDDAFTRGVNVERARLIRDVEGKGSDHPALELVIRP